MASRSKAFVVLVAAALCLAAMRTLAFVGASTTSLDESGDSAVGSLVSAMFMAKLMTGWYGLHFAIAYIFTSKACMGYFKEPPKGNEYQLAVYLCKAAGQNMMPMVLMSVISVVSGIVSKEYMLMLTLHKLFLTGDFVRMITTCEAVGMDKSKLYPYIPIVLVFAFLSYTTWKSMPTSESGDSAVGSLVSAMFMAKLMTVWYGLHFAITYIFTSQAAMGYFKQPPKGKEYQLAVYLCKVIGHNQMPLVLMSVISVVSGIVSKEYMLMLTLNGLFLIGDVVRMRNTCEAAGMDKHMLNPYVPIFLVLTVLSYTTWKAM
jgi:glucose-6-phosphate-specific signal transduction histidine kinase